MCFYFYFLIWRYIWSVGQFYQKIFMGNEQVRPLFKRFQERDFNPSTLDCYDAILWNEKADDTLYQQMKRSIELQDDKDKFQELFEFKSMIDLENSGLDSKQKRDYELGKQLWSTGFTTPEKKLAMLKQGDYKNVVIPTDKDAHAFTCKMQTKICAMLARFYARNQGGTQSLDDFFQFAKKHVAAQEKCDLYRGVFNTQIMPDGHSNIDELKIDHMLATSEKLDVKSMHTNDIDGFFTDLQHRKLNEQLAIMIQNNASPDKARLRAKCATLMFRSGLLRGDASDILKTTLIAQENQLDLSREMTALCKKSEKVVEASDEVKTFELGEEYTAQGAIRYSSGGDESTMEDKYCTDGTHWFMHSTRRGFSKGTKSADTHEWECLEVKSDVKYTNLSLICIGGKLLCRHLNVPDQPFVELDKETLKPTEEQVAYTGANGQDMPLKWTPLDTEYEANDAEGNRWMRQSPLCFDGEYLYVLVPYLRKDYDSQFVKLVVETMEMNGTTLSLESEVTLMHTESEVFLPQKFDPEQTQTSFVRDCSIASNGSAIVLFSKHHMTVFDQSTGIKKESWHINSSSLITYYDPLSNLFFNQDAACYGWLKHQEVKGFKPKDLSANKVKLPKLPIALDQVKGQFIASIKKRVTAEQEEEKKASDEEQEGGAYIDLFKRLIHAQRGPLPETKSNRNWNEESKIADMHEMTKAIVLSFMGTEAHKVINKCQSKGNKKQIGEEMLPFFKHPMAVYVSDEYFKHLREQLQAMAAKVLSARAPSLIDLSQSLNLVKLYHANILCMKSCRIDPRELLSSDEIAKMQNLVKNELQKLSKMQAPQLTKETKDEDLSPEDIFKIHIKHRADELINVVDRELDFEPKLQKLQNLEDGLQQILLGDSGNNFIVTRSLRLISTEDALKDLFESDIDSIRYSSKILKLSLLLINKMVLQRVDNLCAGNTEEQEFQNIYKSLVTFVFNYTQELFFQFGKLILTIQENDGITESEDMSKEKKIQLKTLKTAQARKLELEPIHYENMIMITVYFKEQIFAVSQKVWEAKPHLWIESQKERLTKFFERLAEMYDNQLSISRVILFMTLSICSYKPKVTWLDEVAEALKNCMTALNHYISLSNNFPVRVNSEMIESNKLLPFARTMLKYVNYAIGNTACQLIQRNFGEEDADQSDIQNLSKLNILQGGIEPRFIPGLSDETKTQIEGSFKITHDQSLKELALQGASQIVKVNEDKLLDGIIDKTKSEMGTEIAIGILQISLQKKGIKAPHSRIGGDDGLKLSRAAFAVIVKFSTNPQTLVDFIQEVEDAALNNSTPAGGDGNSGDTNARIIQALTDNGSPHYAEMMKRWEQASQMRKWTQFIKLQISERLKKEISEAYAKELSDSNPSQDQDAFKGSFTEEQKQVIETRFNEQFDPEVQKQYQQVYEKAKLLIRLQVPQTFIEAQKAAESEKMQAKFMGKTAMGIARLFSKEENKVDPGQRPTSARSNMSKTVKNPAFLSEGGMQMTLLNNLDRKVSVEISGSKLGEKDQTVDWRDKLRQWRKIQLSSGAVTSLGNKDQNVFQSCSVSVLGCLQASFSAAQLQKQVEESLVNGLRRSAGLHLINSAIEQSHSDDIFYDMLQWFQGSLRWNKSRCVHYLEGIQGCGSEAENGIKTQFFGILKRILHQLKKQDEVKPKEDTEELRFTHDDRIVYLLNALCLWDFKLNDHESLAKLDIFKNLMKPNDDAFHPLSLSWGQDGTLYGLDTEKEKEFDLPRRLYAAFSYLTRNIIASLLVVEESQGIAAGADTSQSKMKEHSIAVDQAASDKVLSQVIDTIFANFERGLKNHEGFKHREHRFWNNNWEEEENWGLMPLNDVFYSEMFKKGPKDIIIGRRRLAKNMMQLKVEMLIEKITSSEISKNSPLYSLLKNLLGQSVPITIERIVQRKYDAIDAINSLSWQDVNLEPPVLTDEETAKITKIEIEEWKKHNGPKQAEEEEPEAAVETMQACFDNWKEAELDEKEAIDTGCQLRSYNETALIKLIEILDTYLSLSEAYTARTFAIAEKVCNPVNLSVLVRMSIEASPNTQFLAHRLLQSVLRFDVPVEVLNQAVQLASEVQPPSERPHAFSNEVKRILNKQSPLNFEGCSFLQLYFNQLFESRQSLKYASIIGKVGGTSVVDEAVRTIRVSAVIIEKNVQIKQIFDRTVKQAMLERIETMTETEIDTIMTLIPEAQFERMAAGTPCLDKNGKRFIVMGRVITDRYEDAQRGLNRLQQLRIHHNFYKDGGTLVGLFYDATAPDQQDIVYESAHQTRTLIDLDPEHQIAGARESLLMDSEVVTRLIKLLKGDITITSTDPRAADMLKTCVTRGLFAMMKALGPEYVSFIEGLGMQKSFFSYLVDVAKQDSNPYESEESLVSATHLELAADGIREVLATEKQKQLPYKDKVSVVKKDDMDHLKLTQTQEAKDDKPERTKTHHFLIMDKFGSNNWEVDGDISYELFYGCNRGEVGGEAILIDSERLNELSRDTLQCITEAKVIITDEKTNFKQVFRTLKQIRNSKISYGSGEITDICFVVIDHTALAELRSILLKPLTDFDALEDEEAPAAEGAEEEKKGDDAGEAAEEQKINTEEEKKDESPLTQIVSEYHTKLKDVSFGNDTSYGGSNGIIYDQVQNFKIEDSSDDQENNYKSNFKKAVFRYVDGSVDIDNEKHMKLTLEVLRQIYSRKLIFMMTEHGSAESIAQSSIVENEDKMSKLCNLMHIDYMTSADVDLVFGIPHLLRETKTELTTLLKNMQGNQKFQDFFLKDLYRRVVFNAKRFTENDFQDFVEMVGVRHYRKKLNGQTQNMLRPYGLVYMQELVWELGQVKQSDVGWGTVQEQGYLQQDAKKVKWFQMMLEAILVYLIIFKENVDHQVRVNLFGALKNTLRLVFENLHIYEEDQNALVSILGIPLLGDFIMQVGNVLVSESSQGNIEGDSFEPTDWTKLMLQTIVQYIKLKNEAKKRFGRDFTTFFETMEIEKADEIRKVLIKLCDTCQVIQEGISFKSQLADLKFEAMINSTTSSYLVRHLATNFESDTHRFSGLEFQTTLTAPAEHGMEIGLRSLPKQGILCLEKKANAEAQAEQIFCSEDMLKNKDKANILVAKGQQVKITYPAKVNRSIFAGEVRICNSSYPNSKTLTTMPKSEESNSVKVWACHQAVLYMDAQNHFYGCGYRAQGYDSNEEFRKLPIRDIDKLDNIKKVVASKFHRFILCEDSRVFVNGQCRAYSLGSNTGMTGRDSHCYDFASPPNISGESFWPLPEDDKTIVDIAGGKKCWGIVTGKGKIWLNGYVMYRHYNSEVRRNEQQNEDYPYTIDMPEGYKCIKMWLSDKYYTIFATGEKIDDPSIKKTFWAGQFYTSTLNDKFEPLPLPEGTYIEELQSQYRIVTAIDQKQNLWIWGGDEWLGRNNDTGMWTELNAHPDDLGEEGKKQPQCVKWFLDKELKVVKAECGQKHIVVKTIDKDGKAGYYAITEKIDEDDYKSRFGTNYTKVYKEYIYKLHVDESRVLDFSVGYHVTYFVLKPETSQCSIIPEQPDATGMIHFYKEQGGTWKFMCQEEYESQKDSLPDLCFATRHHIAELSSKNFPDLEELTGRLNFANAYPDSLRNSETREAFGAADSIYISKSTISGQVQSIYAGASQIVTKECQKWDLNPLIFYRVKRPAANLDEVLPVMDLTDFFKRIESEQSDQIAFRFQKQIITQEDKDSINDLPEDVEQLIQRATTGFTEQETSELNLAINKQLKIEELTRSSFLQMNLETIKIEHKDLGANSILKKIPEKVLQLRKDLVMKFCQEWWRLYPLMFKKDLLVEGTLPNLHIKSGRQIVLQSILNSLVDAGFSNLSTDYCAPDMNVSRRKAMMFADSGKVDNAGTSSIFGQITTQLDEQNYGTNFKNFLKSGTDDKCFNIKFLGEGGIDAGGLFRDVMVNIAQELESPMLPLFQKTPNNKSDFGNNRECFILNSKARSPVHMKMFKYLGALLGFSIRTKSPLPLNMAPIFWKQLAGEEQMKLEDLNSIDTYSYQMLNNLRQYSGFLTDEDFASTIDQNFTTVLSSGDEVSLCPDGETKLVTKENLNEFIDLVLKARSAEATEQMKALMEGVKVVMCGNFEAMSYLSWEGIEARACGEKVFNVEKLRSITTYPQCANDHAIVGRFWRTFESFSELEKAQYLKFVWGRTRLPIDVSNLSRKHEVRLMDNLSNTGFPQSHTCFFQLDIPDYQDDEICRSRMVQAAELCGQIDNDNNDVADEQD